MLRVKRLYMRLRKKEVDMQERINAGGATHPVRLLSLDLNGQSFVHGFLFAEFGCYF